MSTVSRTALDKGRKTTIWIVIAMDLLLIAFTMKNGDRSMWSEFDQEFNAWTFWNASLMMVTAFVAYLNYLFVAGNRMGRKAWPWMLMALGFVYLAFDDMLILHEREGHAIENALPMFSRENMVVYMDDLIAFGYAGAAMVYGWLFLRPLLPNKKTFSVYMYAIASLVIATCIGLHPAMKSQPLPMAVIQFLHLASVTFFFSAFSAGTVAELKNNLAPEGANCAASTVEMETARRQVQSKK